ncbi:MAG: HD domain-containing protein [Acidimicrobiia bacterium]
MPESWSHLTRRFFWSLRVRPLTQPERAYVASLLEGAIRVAFFEQSTADQRHGLDAARLAEKQGVSSEVVMAALVHDIGKRHARLGVIGRSAAAICGRLGLPTPGRLGMYLDHPRLGADELAGFGANPLIVDFTRHHHGRRPSSIAENDWEILIASDSTVTGPATSDN